MLGQGLVQEEICLSRAYNSFLTGVIVAAGQLCQPCGGRGCAGPGTRPRGDPLHRLSRAHNSFLTAVIVVAG